MSAEGRLVQQTTLVARVTVAQHRRLMDIARRWQCSRDEALRRIIDDVREVDVCLGQP